MASVFGHTLVGYTLSNLINSKRNKLLLILAMVSTVIPDVDVIAFSFGIPYLHPFGHRGFTHSILFAVLWAFLLMWFFGKKDKGIWFAVISLSTISHGLLDAMTSGGRGIGFFIPFNNGRSFFPFREIKVSPIGISKFFSEWGLQVILSEIKYILIPCLIVLLTRFILKKTKKEYISKT
jgi:inner membrane protein